MKKIKFLVVWLLFAASSMMTIVYFGLAVFGEKEVSPFNITLVTLFGILNLFAWGEYILKNGREDKR